MKTYEVPVSITIKATLILKGEVRREALIEAKMRAEAALTGMLAEENAHKDPFAVAGEVTGRIIVHDNFTREI